MRKALRFFLLALGLLVVLVGGFVLWGSTPAQPMPEALNALHSNARVTVTSDDWLTFQPVDAEPEMGLIFYPGGRVDPRAYAPLAQQIAAQGYLVIIIRMPLNLAVLDPDAATDVMAAHPAIKQWIVGGHSLGGSMAANFVYTHPDRIAGLILLAAYPASSNDLSTFGMRVLTISGTRDGLSTPEKIIASLTLLPAEVTWIAIDGANHAQFGWYGEQSGDHPAIIPREEQQAQIVQATVEFLMQLE